MKPQTHCRSNHVTPPAGASWSKPSPTCMNTGICGSSIDWMADSTSVTAASRSSFCRRMRDRRCLSLSSCCLVISPTSSCFRSSKMATRPSKRLASCSLCRWPFSWSEGERERITHQAFKYKYRYKTFGRSLYHYMSVCLTSVVRQICSIWEMTAWMWSLLATSMAMLSLSSDCKQTRPQNSLETCRIKEVYML